MMSDAERIERWEKLFLSGDRSDDEWAVEKLKSEAEHDDEPLLFIAASQTPTLEFLDSMGVNLFQRSRDGSTILMDSFGRLDLKAYDWLARKFTKNNFIDVGDNDGITPLSSKIKFGEIEKARLLLENGASISKAAYISRYGGSRLDIATQAVLCNPLAGDAEERAIEALELLREFGFSPTAEQKGHMLSRVSSSREKVRDWINLNF